MSTVAWQRVWSVFEEVIGRPTDERKAYLDKACDDDVLLREAVENMLEADRKASNLLDQPIVGRPAPPSAPTVTLAPPEAPATDLPAERIGPYRLLKKIGQGGMSTVYLAVRDDDTFRRRVVVKLIRRGLETTSMIHRMQVERQILASLSHPHIARLYDGGATVEGLPYFVMEYVEGETIDRYCARHRLRVDDRIALFLKVCDAVRYAHQNLVVHRDLKPANIMVAADGEPKLLDFGIAKLLNPEQANDGLEPTATWQGALTPSYASPEQVRGKLITTASDVYSLGVVLYRLLTGQLPYDFRGLSPSEIERLMTETEPTRPSAVLGAGVSSPGVKSDDHPSDEGPAYLASHRHALEGDLDAIVLKALRGAPSERYASVEQLTADLDRHRAGRPVLARQGTWRYRATKFVRRNRVAVVTGTVVGTLLAFLGATIVWQSAQVARERDEVILENQKKTQVQRLLVELIELGNPYVRPGEELTVRGALEQIAPLMASRLQRQPEVRAELLHTTGTIRVALGDFEQASSELEEALALRQALFGIEHAETLATGTVLAQARVNLDEIDQAEALARDNVATARSLAASSGEDSMLVSSLVGLVSVLCYQSNHDAAAEPALEAWDRVQRMAEPHPYDIQVRELLGVILGNRGDYEDAIPHYRASLDLRHERQGQDHPEQMLALSNLGLALRRVDRFDEAEAVYRRVLDLHRATFGEEVSSIVVRTELNLGGVLLGRGAYAEAEALFRAIPSKGAEHMTRTVDVALRTGLGQAVLGQGRAAEAEQGLRQLVAEATEQLGPQNGRVFRATSLLGSSISVQGRWEEAEPLLVDSFHALLGNNARARHIDDAFERLRQHLERAGRADEIATYEALRDGT